jgi:Small subunit of acetolactate synthase
MDGAVEGTVARPLTPSEALRVRHQYLQSLHVLAGQFGARIVDVSEHSIIIEMSGKTSRVEAFLSLVKPFGIIESARTGNAHSLAFSILMQFVLTDCLFDLCRFDGYATHSHRQIARGRHD